jgi:hypothetical protein
MTALKWLFAVLCLSLLWGCTSLAEIRYRHDVDPAPVVVNEKAPDVACGPKDAASDAHAYSMEQLADADDAWAGYVEFDDEGWIYTPRNREPTQLQAFEKRLRSELSNPAYDSSDFLVVAFVHGWHHNANPEDCNVHEFRAMLKIAAQRYAQAAQVPGALPHPRRIVGVYVGWRGESVNLEGANETTVLDRNNAADRVARGDVREVFATLRKIQIEQSQKKFGDAPRADRMRTVVIGHSFGGLIAFHGLSPAVLNELTLTKPDDATAGCKPTLAWNRASSKTPAISKASAVSPAVQSALAPVFPDMLVLINPAFEATRFETLHELMRPSQGCSYDGMDQVQKPKVIVVTADNDQWTGKVFTAGRTVLTALEAYPRAGDDGKPSRERDANTHAIGFTERYVTHRLCLKSGADGKAFAVASLTPPADPDWTPLERFAPVWVVRAPPEIINGHDGFLFAKPGADGKQAPYLLDWLVDIDLSESIRNSQALVGTNQCLAGTAGAAPS